jgi:UDP-glucose 4-epimerase
VYSLDNYFTGSEKNHVENVTYIKGATTNIEKLITFYPDIIYHLGEYSRVEQSFDDIEKVWELNKKGTFAVLEFVRKSGSKIVYAGSSTKFGDGGLGRSASPYAWTKATNTEMVMNYGKWFGISYAITYFYNVYGNREISKGKYATLIAIFKEKMKNNEQLTVVEPGEQKRNFTYIKDIICGLILVGDSGSGDEYGIGSEDSYTVLQIAQMFGGKIKMLAERKGNRMSAEVVTKKTKELGWSAKYDICEYVQDMKNKNWQ